MKIIENKDGIATGKIYNIGNPANNYSIRELADMMLELAAEYPEYARHAPSRCNWSRPRSGAYYGTGYQDVQNRVPKIDNTMSELGWAPQVSACATRCARSSIRTRTSWATPSSSIPDPVRCRSKKAAAAALFICIRAY